MPKFQGIEEEEQLRPAPGALDIREQMEQEIEDLPVGPAKEYLMYKKKVMESAALAFLQPEEQIKDFGSDFLPLPLMHHEAILWKEKMRPAVPRNEDGGYEGIPLTAKEAKTLIEDHPRQKGHLLESEGFSTKVDNHGPLLPPNVPAFTFFANIRRGLRHRIIQNKHSNLPSHGEGPQGKDFPTLFIDGYDKITDISVVQHHINLKEGSKFTVQRLRRLGVIQQDALLSEIKLEKLKDDRGLEVGDDINKATGNVEEVCAEFSEGNFTRFEYPKLARFCQMQEEFAEVHGLSQSGKLWKHLSAGDLPKSEWLAVFDTPKYKGSKIFLNMVKPQFVDECRLIFYRVYQEPPRNNEIYLKFATCFVYERCSAAKVDPEAHKIAWALFADNLRAKILDIQSNNKAEVLKNEVKEKKAEFLNKRDALIHKETTTSIASMIQTKITSLQTRYGTLKGANATAKQLVAVEVQITAMSNAVKLIEGDETIADMKIVVESIELGCNERITETVKSMLVRHNPRSSPYFQEPTVSNVKIEEVLGITNKLAYVELLTVVSYSFHHFARRSDAEAAHHMSFETSRGYIENAIGVEEGNFFDLGIASPSGAEKSWTDRKAAKNVGHDTVPLESIVLGATFEEGIEAVLVGDTDAEYAFLAKFVKRFKSNKRTATTTAPGEGKICYQLANLAKMETCESSNFNWFAMQMKDH
ncbi:hypothetical protein L7F22_002135 [Adiantum nelumboides]|nr:hypothetical protein [Adiantum nelumboides]